MLHATVSHLCTADGSLLFLEKEEMSMNNADRAAAGEAMCKFARAVQVGFVL